MPSLELSDRRRNHVLGVLLLALGILTSISVVTYSSTDWPHNLGTSYHNACGPVGAIVAYGLVFALGLLGAWSIPAALLAWGWNRLRIREMDELLVQTLVGGGVVVAFTAFMGLFVTQRWAGHLGSGIALQLRGALHPVGSGLFLGTMLTVLLLVASEVGFSMVAEGAGTVLRGPLQLAMSMAGGLAGLFQREAKPARRRVEKSQPEKPARAAAAAKEPRPTRSFAATLADAADGEDEDHAPIAMPARKPAPQIHLPLTFKRAEGDSGLKAKKEEKKDSGLAPAPRPAMVTSADLPPTTLFHEPVPTGEPVTEAQLKEKALILEKTLAEFGIIGQVRDVLPGPVVTMFEFEPGPGVKVNQIVTRADDLALALRAPRLRILAPIPGKAAVGVEVPNPNPQTVFVREVMEAEAFQNVQGRMPIAVGKDTAGRVFVTDLVKCPHLLVAGATGSGKSVAMNVMMASLLMRHSPETLRMLLIDPKMLELTTYNGIPHLLWPVVTQAKAAARALRWVVQEMENRYKKLAGTGVRHIDSYNAQVAQKGEGEKLPYILVMVDELADLMLTLPMEIEEPIARLAQMARAVGIHLIVATQRPSVDVITGVIKANFPSRMAFQVASKVDSRTILDMNGADALLGNGDMLLLPAGRPEPIRIHGAYISDQEAEALASYWRSRAPAEAPAPPVDIHAEASGGGDGLDSDGGGDDELVAEAARIVVLSQRGSVSLLQRRLKIGYSRAGRIMDQLETLGVVGPFTGSQAREVLADEAFLVEHGLARESEV